MLDFIWKGGYAERKHRANLLYVLPFLGFSI